MSSPHLPNGHLVVFVATERSAVPAGVVRYLSVDGSVPGAEVCWDHHLTGEPINLDAMPDHIDATGFDGVGTTLPDTDALASVVAILLGGPARLPSEARAILQAASHHCDHIAPHPDLAPEVNERGRALHRHIARRIAGVPARERPRAFAELCRALARRVSQGLPLPADDPSGPEQAQAAAVASSGRITHRGGVAVIDLRGQPPVEPEAVYAYVRAPVAVFVKDHPQGGVRYTVGRHPGRADAPTDLSPALYALARAEYAHGPPARAAEPRPEAENWGGRRGVFGSPWNYGSRLSIAEVVSLVEHALHLHP